MTKRTAILITGALTAMMLILVVGVGLALAVNASLTTNAVTSPLAPTTDATVTIPQAPAGDLNSAQLSSDQAATIALGNVPNAKLVRVPELVNYQGTVAYKVVLDQGNVYVDASSGEILFNGATANIVIPALGRESGRGGGNELNQGSGGDGDD